MVHWYWCSLCKLEVWCECEWIRGDGLLGTMLLEQWSTLCDDLSDDDCLLDGGRGVEWCLDASLCGDCMLAWGELVLDEPNGCSLINGSTVGFTVFRVGLRCGCMQDCRYFWAAWRTLLGLHSRTSDWWLANARLWWDECKADGTKAVGLFKFNADAEWLRWNERADESGDSKWPLFNTVWLTVPKWSTCLRLFGEKHRVDGWLTVAVPAEGLQWARFKFSATLWANLWLAAIAPGCGLESYADVELCRYKWRAATEQETWGVHPTEIGSLPHGEQGKWTVLPPEQFSPVLHSPILCGECDSTVRAVFFEWLSSEVRKFERDCGLARVWLDCLSWRWCWNCWKEKESQLVVAQHDSSPVRCVSTLSIDGMGAAVHAPNDRDHCRRSMAPSTRFLHESSIGGAGGFRRGTRPGTMFAGKSWWLGLELPWMARTDACRLEMGLALPDNTFSRGRSLSDESGWNCAWMAFKDKPVEWRVFNKFNCWSAETWLAKCFRYKLNNTRTICSTLSVQNETELLLLVGAHNLNGNYFVNSILGTKFTKYYKKDYGPREWALNPQVLCCKLICARCVLRNGTWTESAAAN